ITLTRSFWPIGTRPFLPLASWHEPSAIDPGADGSSDREGQKCTDALGWRSLSVLWGANIPIYPAGRAQHEVSWAAGAVWPVWPPARCFDGTRAQTGVTYVSIYVGYR